MLSKRMIGGAMLAIGGMARRDRRPRPWDGTMQSAAYAFYPPIEDSAAIAGRSEEVFIGIYSVEGNDQDDIIVWGEGLDFGDASAIGKEYSIELTIQQGCDAATTICSDWRFIDTYLSLQDITGDGMDEISKDSKVTGDFCLRTELMNSSTITAHVQVGNEIPAVEYLVPEIQMTQLDQVPGSACMWGPVDDLKHMGRCLRKYGEVKRSGVIVTEQYCLDRRPSLLFCENDCTTAGTCPDDTTDDCTPAGVCPDDDTTDDCNAAGVCPDDDTTDDCATPSTCDDSIPAGDCAACTTDSCRADFC